MHTCKCDCNHEDNKVKELIPDSWLYKPKCVLESLRQVLSVCLKRESREVDREYPVSTARQKHLVKHSTCKILPKGHNHSALPRTETPNPRSSSDSSLACITHSPLLQSSRILFHLIWAAKPEELCVPPFVYVETFPPKATIYSLSFSEKLSSRRFMQTMSPPSSMLFSGPLC